MKAGRWVVLAAGLILGFLRAPQLLLQPRLWAEEGSAFLQHAFHVSFWSGVFYVEPGAAGYWNLAATLPSAISAHAVSLENAALVATLSAAIPLVLAMVIILFGRSQVFDTPARQIAGIAVLLLSPAATGEVWLNSINAQVYWGFVGLCLLCEDLEAHSPRVWPWAVAALAFGGLSGPYTNLLLPAFIFRAARERTPRLMVACQVLVACTAIQLGTVLFADVYGIRGARWQGFPLDWSRAIAHTVYAQGLVPLLGPDFAHAIATRLLEALPRAAFALAALGGAGLMGVLLERRRDAPSHTLLVALGSLWLGTLIFAQAGTAGGRYAVLSGFALGLLLLEHTRPQLSGGRRLVLGGLLVMSLVIGAASYGLRPPHDCWVACANWREEVAAWRQDPGRRLEVWPQRRPIPWHLRLQPRETPARAKGTLGSRLPTRSDATRSIPPTEGPQ